MGRTKGKVTLVTGAASGIGRSAATLFANEGAKLVVADISKEGGQETVNIVREAGGGRFSSEQISLNQAR